MKCYKCGKEILRGIDGIAGIAVDVTIEESDKTVETVNYNNLQLGKYSNGKGECHLATCYECYIDTLLK